MHCHRVGASTGATQNSELYTLVAIGLTAGGWLLFFCSRHMKDAWLLFTLNSHLDRLGCFSPIRFPRPGSYDHRHIYYIMNHHHIFCVGHLVHQPKAWLLWIELLWALPLPTFKYWTVKYSVLPKSSWSYTDPQLSRNCCGRWHIAETGKQHQFL